jgi:hypothetical protein
MVNPSIKDGSVEKEKLLTLELSINPIIGNYLEVGFPSELMCVLIVVM